MDRYLIIALIIKRKRQDLGYKAEYVAKLANISLSYLSMIEHGTAKPNEQILSNLFKILEIEYNEDQTWLENHRLKINNVHKAILDYDVEKRNNIYNALIKNEEELLNSILVADFLIMKLGYLVTVGKECDSLIRLLEHHTNKFQSDQYNLYAYYLGVNYKNKLDLKMAKDTFISLLDKGVQLTLLPMIYYQLGQIENRLNDELKSFSFNDQAYKLFMNIGNMRRAIQVLSQMALTYTTNGRYKQAELIYERLIDHTKSMNLSKLERNIIYNNASLNAIKQGDFDHSLKLLNQLKADSDQIPAFYFNKAWSLYNKKSYKKLMEFINFSQDCGALDRYINDCLTLIKYLCSTDDQKIEATLKKIETYISKEGDYDAKEFIYGQFVELYQRQHQYKNAFKYSMLINSL